MAIPQDEGTTARIDILPDEIIVSIFKLLPLEVILECENVCSRWKKLARDAGLWRQIVLTYSGKSGQSEVSEKTLVILETHQDCVRCLKIQYVHNYQVIKSIIQKCQNLISLELVMCRVSKDFEKDITKWPNLKKINLKNSLALTSNVDLTIAYDNFKYLKYLALSDFGLPATTRDTLLSCHYLSHIFIEKVKNLNLEFVHNLIQSKLEILQAFHIYGAEGVSNETLYILSQCKLLKDLAIIRCENLTDAGLINLVNFSRIEQLQIWNNSNFSEVTLRRALESPSLVKLKSLSLSKIGNISPLIVDVISEHYKNLKFLAVYQCPRIINTDYEKQLKSKFRNIDVVLY